MESYKEKVNIYVPENIGSIIKSDAEMFEIYKNDGRTVNKNRFLSMLILGYYDDYSLEKKDAFESILSELSSDNLSVNEREQMASRVLNAVFLPKVPSRKGKNPVKLSLKPTKDTEAIIAQMMQNSVYQNSISQQFCKMIMSYCEKPFTKREQIIFREKYDTLQLACEAKRSIVFKTIWNKKVIHEVCPYKIVSGPEELFSYLLCAEINPTSGKQEARSYRLNRIDKINYGKNIYTIDNRVKGFLEKMLYYGPQYMINEDIESCVRLTESGVRSFSRIYYGRPIVDRIEEKPDGSGERNLRPGGGYRKRRHH